MTFYSEMFFSKWHLITAVMMAIAWISLIAGGYERRVVLRSGMGAMVFLYVVTTIPIATITYQEKSIDTWMRQQIVHHYEEKMQRIGGSVSEIDRLAVAAGSFKSKDIYKIYIYAGNYNDSYRFDGRLVVRIYDKQGKELDESVFDGLHLEPGEVKKVDSFHLSSSFEIYRYEFEPQKD
ncbi:hypothetical protein ACI7RC_14320 [Brevibacillus sp. B_LB10_24]|uniref:hypothetical protein n=1 Tax=Brevibacillus sp. B_LB10_24 TaxID=3380645 RepID=UPI0038BC7A2E